MHFRSAFIAAAAIYLVPQVIANEEPLVDVSEPATDIIKPVFVPTDLKAPFLEQFTDDWETRWQASHAKKDDKSTEEEWAYVGTWAVEEPSVLPGIDGDKGLVLKDKAAHHAISAKFPKKIENKGKDLVVQYEVKLQDGLECGGAYMKLLQDNKALHAEEFSNASPYIIMFGPDKCGSTNKVHFIFRHKNPKTGEYEEKHMSDAPRMYNDKLTNLYTLIVRKDQTFQIRVNGDAVRNGTLHDDFSPSVNPEKEIDDPKDKKPSDWVEKAKIEDPEAVKPDDWDEDAPFEIVDEEAEKPEDWLDNEPEMVADPEAEKPEDWDDEEDGDWIPPNVPNPKCAEVSGCGTWEKPTKKNPDYKGKWTAPMIDNPEYKGVWKPRKIANPDYFEDKTPSNFEAMGAIGFELWTMQGNILFDNIYIGHSLEDAESFKTQTYDVKHTVEKAEEDATKPEDDFSEPTVGKKFMEDPVNYVKDKVDQFIVLVKDDPVQAAKTVPEVAGAIGVLIVTVVVIIVGGLGAGAQSPAVQEQAKKAKNAAVDAKDKASDAVSSGAEKVAAEANRRTTRSAASAEGSS